MSLRSLDGYSVLVTGGGSGLGAGAARYLAARGARVTICGRREQALRAVVASIGANCAGVVGDVTVAGDRQRMLETAIAHGGRLDGLVNNAGNMLRGELASLNERSVLELFHTNVVGAMMLTGLCVPALAERRGAVVFLGSIHNRRAFPGVSPYAATKGAIESLTRSLAAELGAQGIRVNCVAPGAVLTEINQRAGLMTDEQARERLDRMRVLHALGRTGTEEEIAEAIAYLLTAEWTTGAILDVDGGLGLGITGEPVTPSA
ncbi:MAG: SDR family oxidoreductase [Pseudomonadales bacterium]